MTSGTQKSVLERKAPPTFPLVIEMRERAYWVTHWVEDSVDCLLHAKVPVVQVAVLSLPPDSYHVLTLSNRGCGAWSPSQHLNLHARCAENLRTGLTSVPASALR
jgi:hypothetical protein